MALPLVQRKDVALGTALPNFAPGFVAYGIVIDNDTGNWLLLTPGNYIIPPWTYGWSQPLNGTQSISLTLLAGPSIIPSANLGTFVRLTITEERVPQSNGFTAVTAANVTSAITIAGPVSVTGTVGISGSVNVSGSNVNAVVTNTVGITGSVTITAGTVTIGGTVDVSGSTVTATVSNTVTITGSVSISAGTVTVSGTVSISGGVTITSGTVDIGTVAGTVTITGTITNTINANVTNSIAVTSVGGTVTVAGTINIGNTPAVTISGTPNVNIASGTVSISGTITVGSITAGNVSVNPGTFTLGGQGDAAIGVTGTAFQLSLASVPTQVVMLKAFQSNADTIYIGKATVTNAQSTAGNRSTTNGMQLAPGDMIVFPATNLNAIYLNGNAGDGVSYEYWT